MKPEVEQSKPRGRCVMDILRLSEGGEVHLCDSPATADPDVAGVALKSRKTVVWARVGPDGPWYRTGFKWRRRALDACLNRNLRTPADMVNALAATAGAIETTSDRRIGSAARPLMIEAKEGGD